MDEGINRRKFVKLLAAFLGGAASNLFWAGSNIAFAKVRSTKNRLHPLSKFLPVANTKDLQRTFKNSSELEYGPFFSRGKDGQLYVSFGVNLFQEFREKIKIAGEKKEIRMKAGTNRFFGPWEDSLSKLFGHYPAMKKFLKDQKSQSWPQQGVSGTYRVGFGSCIREGENSEQWIFNRIAKKKPNAFMLIGDIVYNDLPSNHSANGQLDTKYERQLKVEFFKKLFSTTPMYSIWDDHDFWENNTSAEKVSRKIRTWSRKLFTSILPNPSHGEYGEGIYFKWSIGDVDFFMLDTRWFRRTKSGNQLLGDQQTQWLKRELKQSNGTFKVLVSSVQWNDKGKGECWKKFKEERDSLFRYIFEEKISGILLLSGDIHQAAAYRLNPNLNTNAPTYPLYEFTSSGLAVPAKSKSSVRSDETKQILNVKGKYNFGMLEFHTEGEDPYVDLTVHTLEAQEKWKNGDDFYQIYASELDFT